MSDYNDPYGIVRDLAAGQAVDFNRDHDPKVGTKADTNAGVAPLETWSQSVERLKLVDPVSHEPLKRNDPRGVPGDIPTDSFIQDPFGTLVNLADNAQPAPHAANQAIADATGVPYTGDAVKSDSPDPNMGPYGPYHSMPAVLGAPYDLSHASQPAADPHMWSNGKVADAPIHHNVANLNIIIENLRFAADTHRKRMDDLRENIAILSQMNSNQAHTIGDQTNQIAELTATNSNMRQEIESLKAINTRQLALLDIKSHNAGQTVDCLKFLLSQAPMQFAPETIERAAHSVTKYAYVHPETFKKLTGFSLLDLSIPGYRIAPSPTQWLGTELMPKGLVIYGPNLIPGAEGRPTATSEKLAALDLKTAERLAEEFMDRWEPKKDYQLGDCL